MLSKAGFASFVLIRDMDRAIKFYTKTLGGKLQMHAEGEMKDAWASIKIGKEEFWLVNPPGRRKKPDLAFNTFIVKNIKAYVTGFRKKGVKFEPAEKSDATTRVDGPIAYDPFGASAFFRDSEGNLLMLWQGT
ncbi:MAG: VOC family protein [Nitrososphaerales archaeon]